MKRNLHEIRGVWTRGDEPKELVLSDGSRLLLESGTPEADADTDHAGPGWRRTDGRDETAGAVSVPEAIELAGDDYAGYVEVRTRAEAEWLRAIADWCGTEAARLERGLVAAAT
jgi:hypothetical protein